MLVVPLPAPRSAYKADMAVIQISERHAPFTTRTAEMPDGPVVVRIAFLDLIRISPRRRCNAHGHTEVLINDTPETNN